MQERSQPRLRLRGDVRQHPRHARSDLRPPAAPLGERTSVLRLQVLREAFRVDGTPALRRRPRKVTEPVRLRALDPREVRPVRFRRHREARRGRRAIARERLRDLAVRGARLAPREAGIEPREAREQVVPVARIRRSPRVRALRPRHRVERHGLLLRGAGRRRLVPAQLLLEPVLEPVGLLPAQPRRVVGPDADHRQAVALRRPRPVVEVASRGQRARDLDHLVRAVLIAVLAEAAEAPLELRRLGGRGRLRALRGIAQGRPHIGGNRGGERGCIRLGGRVRLAPQCAQPAPERLQAQLQRACAAAPFQREGRRQHRQPFVQRAGPVAGQLVLVHDAAQRLAREHDERGLVQQRGADLLRQRRLERVVRAFDIFVEEPHERQPMRRRAPRLRGDGRDVVRDRRGDLPWIRLARVLAQQQQVAELDVEQAQLHAARRRGEPREQLRALQAGRAQAVAQLRIQPQQLALAGEAVHRRALEDLHRAGRGELCGEQLLHRAELRLLPVAVEGDRRRGRVGRQRGQAAGGEEGRPPPALLQGLELRHARFPIA